MSPPQEPQTGRRSTDVDLAVLMERLEVIGQTQERILVQVIDTNHRTSELEVKERIRLDREEREANRCAASEAAKWRVEQHLEEQAAQAQERHENRITGRIMLLTAVVAAACSSLFSLIAGHL